LDVDRGPTAEAVGYGLFFWRDAARHEWNLRRNPASSEVEQCVLAQMRGDRSVCRALKRAHKGWDVDRGPTAEAVGYVLFSGATRLLAQMLGRNAGGNAGVRS
jgi:hypothetical protein